MRRLIAVLLVEPTDNGLIQLFRYAFVGGFAFVVDFGVLAALTELAGLHYLISAAIAFLCGLTTNYLISICWVFNRRTVESRAAEFALYGAIGVVGLGINELMLWLLTDIAGLHYLASKVISTFVVFAWNFLARKLLLFR